VGRRNAKALTVVYPLSGSFTKRREMIEIRIAVLTRIFPLYEIEHGENYSLNIKPEFHSVQEYLKLQGRFSHLNDSEIEVIQENVEKAWVRLVKKAEA
jgi:pyruvate/2-oxoacid:ferredoxin oxidoreductase beta subunit